MIKFRMMLLTLGIFTFPVFSKNLGVIGDTWLIQEKNLLTLIEERLNEQFGGKSEQEIQEEIQKRIIENSLNPEPNYLPKAEQSSIRMFDPSYTVQRDIADHQGNVFAKKGQVVNPFDITDFGQTLIFIDGTDDSQIDWIQHFKADTEIVKIILTNGNLKKVSDTLDEAIYFDQKGVLINRFGIKAVPTIIDQAPNQKLLRIREIGLK
ncbi:type-F conjugative transfer system protein TraW [Pasteurella multocida]|uniref:type-F conjugative transfer system protein TraW n=1 Tax=Pasteurella multocida TaxID=747 RepID=UPI002FE3A47F